jgi:predicted RNA binding protein YcfA (HicA-like mRNA interferase family)
MTDSLRYADLLRLLEGLGFECGTVKGAHRLCEHRPSETLIVRADRPADEVVREQVVTGVRLQLEARGLLDRDEFGRQAARMTSRETGDGTRPARKRAEDARSRPV